MSVGTADKINTISPTPTPTVTLTSQPISSTPINTVALTKYCISKCQTLSLLWKEWKVGLGYGKPAIEEIIRYDKSEY